jgi:UDP:flavonoid glycosyltransferase YjiC (YdhE family)
MRVLFTTFAWPSHYHPMVPLAWALRATGHEVRMASQPALLPAMRESGLPSTVVGRDVDLTRPYRGQQSRSGNATRSSRVDTFFGHLVGDLELARQAHAPATVEALREEARSMFHAVSASRAADRSPGFALYAEVAAAMVDDLLRLVRSWRPDLIVFDHMTYAGPMVSAVTGIPAVRHLFDPDITYFIPVTSELEGWAALLDRLGLDRVDQLGVATLDRCPPDLQFPQSVAPAQRVPIQHIPYHGLAEVPRWLSDPPARPRICVSWGTTNDRMLGEAPFPADVLYGCVKLADERRAELVLTLTAGQRHLLPDLPPHVLVVESVPHDALLASCEAIIHQGGGGTMLTAARHGLPQLILPRLVNQPVNACRLVATGAGRTLPAVSLSTSDLLTAGHELLDDPAYRIAARRLRENILRQPVPTDAVPALERLAVAR